MVSFWVVSVLKRSELISSITRYLARERERERLYRREMERELTRH